jgi:hypothetical protein
MNLWPNLLAAVLAGTFSLLGAFHVAWAFGARKAAGVIPEVNGKLAFHPGPASTLAVAAALFACAWLIAAVAGWTRFPVPDAWLKWLAYALAAAFFARAIGDFRLVGFFKKVQGTPFARLDSLYFSPLCLAIAIAVLALAWFRYGGGSPSAAT